MISDYELLAAMRSAMHHLSPGSSGGSHTEVFRFDPLGLGEVYADLAARHGGDPKKARDAGIRMGSRFLVKVGNIRKYVVKLKGGRESSFPRHMASEAFGAAGYSMAPTLDKVRTDSREAVREIPYFATGTMEDQFAPDVLSEARALVTGVGRPIPPDGTFLVVEEDGGHRSRRDAWSILAEDPYFPASIPDFGALVRYQEFLRANPIDPTFRERMQAFFDAPMTVGFRDVLRWLEGARHPDVGWKRAEGVIRRCFDEFGMENFLPPEINYYTRSIERTPDELAALERSNARAAEAFARWMVEWMPFGWTTAVPDRELLEIAETILRTHFDYPVYEVESYAGPFSMAMARLALRAGVQASLFLAGVEPPERRNPISDALLDRMAPVARFLDRLRPDERSEFFVLVNRMLWEVAARGGVPDEDEVRPYRRIDQTFYSFQERAQNAVADRGTVEGVYTLEDLYTGKAGRVLEERPPLARKLVVFFTLVYRYFLDSGHVPDLRPDDAGGDLFVRGIWGYSTKNVLVVTGRDTRGRPMDVVRFVDNKDQFKQYRRAEDRDRPLGLAKYGLRLVHPLVEPAMERSIGVYTEKVAVQEEGPLPPTRDLPALAARMANEVLRKGVDGATTHTQAFLHDLVDDAADGLESVLRRVPRGPKPRQGA